MTRSFPNLGALQAGDNAAWNVAFDHLWPIARLAAQSPQAGLADSEIEDAASAAMIEFVSKIEQVTSVDHAKALLTLIARNCAISRARKNSAAKRRPLESAETDSTETVSQFSGLTELERCEMILLLRQALSVLDAQTRLILLEKNLQGLTCREISEKYGIPLGTVCIKAARGLGKVRDYLRESPALMKELQAYLRY